MSQNTIDCPNPETFDQGSAVEPTKMRYDVILRARRDIREGLYDDDAKVESLLAGCMDRIVGDTQES
ncbi:MAG: hypothetical protein AAF085_03800 [Planctomycetota bacterium]